HESRTETIEIDLWVRDFSDIKVVGNLATEPRFEIPLTTIDEMPDQFNGDVAEVHIAGIVESHQPGKGFVVRDTTGQVMVRTLQTIPLQIGDIAEAVGQPFTGGADWMLRNSLIRRASPEVAQAVDAAKSQPNRTLRLARDVLALRPEEAASGMPVYLTGMVLRSRTNSGVLFLRDTSGTVRVEVPPDLDSRLLKNGTGLRLKGVTTAGSYAPGVRAIHHDTWGGSLLPEAKPVSLDQALSGAEEGNRIELRGYAASLTRVDGYMRLTVGTATGDFTAIVSANEEVDNLIGSIVSVRGVCQAVADENRRLTGIEVWASSMDDIRLEQAALDDPFAVPLRRVEELRQFRAHTDRNFWTRIRGVVTDHRPGGYVFVQDGEDGILVLAQQQDPLEPGDIIEATGLPGLENRRAVLREA